MLRSKAFAVAALLAVLGCASAYAGDFVPRTAGNFAAVGDDPGVRTTCPEALNAAMSEPDSAPPPPAHSSPGVTSPRSAPIRSAKHIGVDDAVLDNRPAGAADVDDKSAAPGAHKAHSGLRWQSLLPGVMK